MFPEGMFPGMPSGGSGGDAFKRMLLEGLLGQMRNKKDDEFEVFGPLSEADKVEWEAIRVAHSVLVNKAKALEAQKEMNDARRKSFWAKIEEDTGIFDKNMRITDDFRLLIEKDTPEKKDEGCSGDCASCSGEDQADSPFPPEPERPEDQ